MSRKNMLAVDSSVPCPPVPVSSLNMHHRHEDYTGIPTPQWETLNKMSWSKLLLKCQLRDWIQGTALGRGTNHTDLPGMQIPSNNQIQALLMDKTQRPPRSCSKRPLSEFQGLKVRAVGSVSSRPVKQNKASKASRLSTSHTKAKN